MALSVVFVLWENSARPALDCTCVYPRSLRLNFFFFFKYLIDSHLPQPEVLGYVIYNINILEKNRVIFNLDK